MQQFWSCMQSGECWVDTYGMLPDRIHQSANSYAQVTSARYIVQSGTRNSVQAVHIDELRCKLVKAMRGSFATGSHNHLRAPTGAIHNLRLDILSDPGKPKSR